MTHPGLGLSTYRAWCELLDIPAVPCAPLARVSKLPPWMAGELVATAAARRKLRAWTARGRAWAAALDAGDLLLRVHMYGDIELCAIAVDTITGLPPPVVDYIERSVTFTAAGWTIAGSCGARPDFGDRAFHIMVSAADGTVESVQRVVAEEVAHAWLLEEPAPGVRSSTAFEWHTRTESAVPAGVSRVVHAAIAAHRREHERQEQLAAALIRRWGFV